MRSRSSIFFRQNIKYLRQSLFFNKISGQCQRLFNKVASLRAETLFKKRLWHTRFSVNFAKSLTARFLQNTSGRLLLLIQDLTEIIKSIKVIFLIKMTFFPSLLVKPQTISSTLKCLKNDFLSNKLTVTKKFFPRSLINPSLIQNPWQKLTFDAARKLVTYYHYYAKMRMI